MLSSPFSTLHRHASSVNRRSSSTKSPNSIASSSSPSSTTTTRATPTSIGNIRDIEHQSSDYSPSVFMPHQNNNNGTSTTTLNKDKLIQQQQDHKCDNNHGDHSSDDDKTRHHYSYANAKLSNRMTRRFFIMTRHCSCMCTTAIAIASAVIKHIITGMFVITGLILGMWLFRYTILVPHWPEDTCEVATWAQVYPTCHDQVTHHNNNNNNSFQVLNSTQWVQLRQLYYQSTTQTSTTSSSRSTTSTSTSSSSSSLGDGWNDTDNDYKDGWLVNVDVRYSPGKGRGVFAATNATTSTTTSTTSSSSSSSSSTTTTRHRTVIPKGTKIWDSRYRGIFDSQCAAKRFFASLHDNSNINDAACSVMFWGYANNFYGPDFRFMIDLDGHGYMNHCSKGSPGQNVEHHFEHELETDDYALPHFLSYPLLSPTKTTMMESLLQWPWYVWTTTTTTTTSPSTTTTTTDQRNVLLEQRNIPGSHGMYASRDIVAGEELCFDYEEVHIDAIMDYFAIMFQRSLKIHQWFIK